MKRGVSICLFTGVLLFLAAGYPIRSNAEVDIGISVVLPPVVIPAPPEVVVIPRTYVYYVPDVEVDILFYHGFWYRPYRGYWYRSRSYNGPWANIVVANVPRVLVELPPDFRHVPPGHRRIPHGHLKKNWKTWERERYWDRPEKRERFKEEKWERREEKGKGKGKGKGRGKHRDD